MRRRLTTFAVGIALTAALTACGGDDGDNGGGEDSSSEADDFADQPPADIVAAAQEAMGALESLHITGDLVNDGTSITMDLSLSTAGDCEGSVGIDGGGLEVLQVDGEGWFKADETFWRAQAPGEADQIIAATGDKWVVDADGQFTSFCDLEGFLEDIVSPDDGDEDFEVEGSEEVDGHDAVKLTGDEASAWIASDEPHHILKLEGGADEPGTITFTEFDEDVDVEAPAEADTVTLP